MEIRTQPQNGGQRRTLGRAGRGPSRATRSFSAPDEVYIYLSPGADVQGTLDANLAGGANFIFRPGTYRITTPLDPRANQTLIGERGAIISGSEVLTGWTQDGSDWWTTRAGQTAEQPDDPGDGSRCAITGCENPHDVFLNGAPLVRVASQVALAPGAFWEDFINDRVYIRDNPNLALVEQAVASRLLLSSNSNVELRNLVFEQAANGAQTGAVEWDGSGWEVSYCEFRYNHGIGVRMDGAGFNVHHNHIHHQMQMGYGGDGSNGFFELNLIHDNNRDASYDHLWEGGGGKHALNANVKVRWNHSHDNNGPGLWADINCSNFDFAGNYVHDNLHTGIFYELSYAETTASDGNETYIRSNYSFDNADGYTTGFYSGAQILVSATRGPVKVYDNVVRGWEGIGGLAQLRTDHPDARGSHQLHDLSVYDNQIECTYEYPTSGTGWGNAAGIKTDDVDNQEPEVWDSHGNSFSNNDYFVPDSPGDPDYPHWTWHGDIGTDFCDFATWQGTYGQDTTGSRTIGGHVTIPDEPSLTVGPQ